MLQQILDWSEIWALLIPIVAFFLNKKQPAFLKSVIFYVFLALILNSLIDFGWYFNTLKLWALSMGWEITSERPKWLVPNIYLYHLHSIIRFLCFSVFFHLLRQGFLKSLKQLLFALTILGIIIDFTYFDNFFDGSMISSFLLATEAGVLLFYCLAYFLSKLQEDSTGEKKQKDFWVVIGVGIYVCFNFPFFLMYRSLSVDQSAYWWNFHNVSYIILCIFIAKAFYVPGNRY